MDHLDKMEILQILSMEKYIPARKLAEKSKIGEKTLRKRMKELKEELERNGASIEIKHGQGYRLKVEKPKQFLQWEKRLQESEQKVPNTPRERIRYILLLLLSSTSYVKREMIGDFLYISEQSVSQLLKYVEFIFEKYDLALKKKSRYGMRVRGHEFSKRQCIMNHYLLTGSDWRLLDQKVCAERVSRGDILSDIIMEERLSFTELALKYFIDYIYVTERRIRQGVCIETSTDKNIDEENMQIAERILLQLKKRGVGVSLKKAEIAYTALYLQGNCIQQMDGAVTKNMVIDERIDSLTEEILKRIYCTYQVEMRGNLNLRMYLNRHMVSLDIRLTYGIAVKNPLLQEIKEKYFFPYLLASQAAVVLKGHYKKSLSEDEISYLAMIFEAEHLQNGDRQKKSKVLLVCATGKISARFLLLSLQKKFSGSIDQIELCSLYELEQRDLKEFDYIFSTVPIDKKVNIPIIILHDFGTQLELAKVQKAMDHSYIQRFFKKEFFFTDVSGETKEEVIKELCRRVAQIRPLPEDFCESVLFRESMGSTDFGNMMAIPHPYEKKLKDNLVCAAVLKRPVLWQINQVQLVILSALNGSQGSEIQKFFEMVSKLMLRKDLIDEIIREQAYETLCDILERM